jgi:hypothetical protein
MIVLFDNTCTDGKFLKPLREDGCYSILEACDGVEALHLLTPEKVYKILSKLLMPYVSTSLHRGFNRRQSS